MKIYLSLQTHRKTQGFGENKACITTQNRIVPTSKYGRCPDNSRPFYKSIGMEGHNGEDWACFFKEPIYFPVVAHIKGGGVTKWYSKDASDMSGGLGVDVFSRDPVFIDILPTEAGPNATATWKAQNRYLRVKFRFWHLHSGWRDKNVVLGEMVGLGDSTGASSGNHLHWGMKFVDDNDNTLDSNNGYFGGVDFSPWMQNKFILDKLGKKPALTNAQKVYKVAYYFRMPILNEVGKLLDN